MILHMYKIIVVIAVTIGLLLSAVESEAKVLPRFSGKFTQVRSSGVVVSPRLRADRKALLLYIGNLNQASSVVYTLIYETNGKQEGVYGSVDSSTGNAVTKGLEFGTCSSGVCRYHEGLSNMKLEVVIELTSGKKITRRYRVKI